MSEREQPGQTGSEPGRTVPDREPSSLRSGLDVAREALAAARGQAQRRAVAGRQGSAGLAGGAARGSTRDAASEAGEEARRRGGRSPVERRSGARPDDRDPQPLSSTVDGLIAQRGWQRDAAVAAVLTRWAEIVGPELAGHCRAESCSEGTVVVAADSTAWATQLRLLAPQLLARLRDELGPELGQTAIRRVQVRGPVAPSWRRGPRAVRGRGPRDTYG